MNSINCSVPNSYKYLRHVNINIFSIIKNARKLTMMLTFPIWLRKKFAFLKPEEWKVLFNYGSYSIPHYKKRAKGGEDASFESENLLVVADGVGGWNEMGIDPALYSRRLVDLVVRNFAEYEKEYAKGHKSEPLKVDENLIRNMIVKSVFKNREQGSSTLSVLYLDKVTNMLYSGYLGDSCYMVARPKEIGKFEVFFKSDEQTHGFNIPYQVGREGDDPKTAIIKKHKVEKNDLIILASDGLWDNLEVKDILGIVNKISQKRESVSLDTKYLAEVLSSKAEKYSRDPNHCSPFVKRAFEQGRRGIYGGKPDDITIIIAQIVQETRCENTSDDTSSMNSVSTDADLESTKD